MRSTSQLWFHIETAFTEVQELCVRARAAQLATERTTVPSAMRRTMVSQGGLPKDLEPAQEDDPRLRKAAELARDMAFREENQAGPDLVILRAQVRKRLVWLKSKFAEVFSDHDVYYALFPIVVHFDEFIQVSTRGEAARWEPIQGELYDIDNGGELFFTILQDRLRQQETHPMVLEIFYYRLVDGFAGAYEHDPKKIEEYRDRLVERIILKPVEAPEKTTGGANVELVRFPWQYYAIAAAVVIGTYALLSWLAIPA
ncbi:MAG: DotU family type IV/VI secretion system protein [Polyangiaceae bacterium]